MKIRFGYELIYENSQPTPMLPVVEHPDCQWSDSRITIWIADSDDHVLKLEPDLKRSAS
jgi:hypothetical protein